MILWFCYRTTPQKVFRKVNCLSLSMNAQMKHIPQYTEQMTETDLVPYILYAVVAGKIV